MDIIQKAIGILRRDGIVVYPTETVYGLGVDALSEAAVLKAYEVKGRPLGKPISVAVCDEEMLLAISNPNDAACRFIDRFLPGPVTVVLPATSCILPILTGGTGLVGIRWPDQEQTLSLIEGLDAPITATSANVSGTPAPTRPDEVNIVYDLIIDAGPLPGTPSTVVDLCARSILRAGPDVEEIARFLASME
jgi:L-threonylcarbamoyladenylate synthase